jgi:hypothetical protein
VDLTLAGNTGNLARTGYTFAGWNTADDGSGTQYYTAARESARDWDVTADTELIAYWMEVGGVGPAGGVVYYDKGS